MIEQGAVQVINGFLYLLAAVLLLSVPVIGTRIVLYVKAKWAEISRSQPEFIRTMVESAAKFGIAYAQQKFAEDTEVRKEKLEAAIKVAKNFLASSGFHGIDTTTIEYAIEALLIPTKLELKEQKVKLETLRMKNSEFPASEN